MKTMSVCDSLPTCQLSKMNSSGSTYKCGACGVAFTSTCRLHQHLLTHSPSYLYDDEIKVAFPKFKTLFKSTQTDTDLFLVSIQDNVEYGDEIHQPMETIASDKNVEDNNDLPCSFDVRKHFSQSDKCNLAIRDYTKMTDAESDASEEYTEKTDVHQNSDIYNHGNAHIEDMKQSTAINIKVKTTVFTPPENDEIKSEQIKGQDLPHEDVGSSQEISSLGNIKSEVALDEDSERNETETIVAVDQRDKDKPTEYFYGKITSNKYCVERERPKHNFGEKNELLKVKVTKTWYPPNCAEYAKQKDKESVKDVLHCAECSKTYSNKVSLEYHMNTHEGKRPYLCQDCGLAYSSKNTLNMHRIHHHGEKQHECHVCKIMLPSAARLREHVSIHARTKDYVYECLICDRLYKSKKNLQQHVHNSHNEKQKMCQNCKKVFPSRKEYLKHRNKCHERKLDCDQCGKSFSSGGSLQRHIAIHTNHRPHKCHICHRKFLQKGQYWIHMVKYHDLTKDDLTELFPDKHLDKHVRRRVNNREIREDEHGDHGVENTRSVHVFIDKTAQNSFTEKD